MHVCRAKNEFFHKKKVAFLSATFCLFVDLHVK